MHVSKNKMINVDLEIHGCLVAATTTIYMCVENEARVKPVILLTL